MQRYIIIMLRMPGEPPLFSAGPPLLAPGNVSADEGIKGSLGAAYCDL
jgi:hypothetical protein